MSGVDLVQWLTAQLDADAAPIPMPAWHEGYCMEMYVEDGTCLTCGGEEDPANVTYQERSPRALLEVESKRKLLALLPELEEADRSIEGEWGSSDDLAGKLLDALLTPYPKCGATTVFWPDDEACDAVCVWPRGHGGARHIDETLGEWDEGELTTSYPSE